MTPEDMREEIDTLREENRQLREMLAPDCWRLRMEFGLRPKAAVVLGTLIARERVSMEVMETVVWPDWRPDNAENNIKVYIWELRKKLPEWAKIITIYGFGYSLEPEARKRLRAIENSGSASLREAAA